MPDRSYRLRWVLGFRLSSILITVLFATGCDLLGLGDDTPVAEDGDETVLFIGSSYLAYNTVPDRFRDLCEKAGHEVYVRYHLSLGQPLSYFAQSPGAKEAIRDRDWDYVVLQGSAVGAAYPATTASSPYSALRELHRIATEDSPTTKVVYMMPWAYEDGMLWAEGRTEDYEQMQLDIRDHVLDWADDLDLVIAPVGMAFYKVLTTWPHGEHFLHDSDWNHASEEGSYLAASTFAATVWKEDFTDVASNWKIDGETARDLREAASATVLDNLDQWRITP